MENMQIVPAYKNVEPQHVEMKVPLYSYGCERKIKKALSHLRGIYSVNVDHKLQKVTVWGICNRDDVLATIRNKRREAHFWGSDESTRLPLRSKNKTTTRSKGWKAWMLARKSFFMFP
ncbi:copper transport protein ATX1 [Aristolochia californica]|uniref:copper transport protein ATX1 n=1 Tax=Aristolochia californica TaxID=171875 RepID=UPI0035E0421C